MSAQPSNQVAPDLINIEIDGVALQAAKGSMIIQAADKAGIALPRFCYHQKLPIAANCRMCMVDVEKMPKPAPACATPVMEGMKIYTQSKRALDAQRNVMEFLLINHPLDCPICDQGGECELQDTSLGYGRSVSRFNERKRVVADEDIGPLVATDMTRCIQCTRCIRVSAEICASYELGGMQRGERLEIGTYDGKPLSSELSGNVIDVCPVGALTNKVFRFRARAWELLAHAGIGYHDALGSNLYLHVRRGEVLRCVPRDNEAVNECWLSDRDRYSHQGLSAADRATRPMLRKGGELVAVDWPEAIAFVAEGLKRHGGDALGALVAPLTSNEEGYLLAQIVRGLGSEHIDHRLRTLDFADAPVSQPFAMPLAAIESARRVLLIGSNPRMEQPLLAHRLRKAVKHGAQLAVINPVDFDLLCEVAARRIVTPLAMVDELAALAKLLVAQADVPAPLAALIAAAEPNAAQRAVAELFTARDNTLLLFGDIAVQHPAASLLRALAKLVANAIGAAFNELPAGANSIGLARVGVLAQTPAGKNAAQIMAKPGSALLVYHAGSQDTATAAAYDLARTNSEFHVYIGGYACAGVKRTAHAILPIGLPPEIEGSLVNVDGSVQRFAGGAKLPGEARPGWRVLRALGAALGLPGFEFTAFSELAAQVQPLLAKPALPVAGGTLATRPQAGGGLARITTVPIYRSDAVVRRAAALQAHPLNAGPRALLHPEDALALGLAEGAMAKFADDVGQAVLPVSVSGRVAKGAVWIESGYSATAPLSATARLTVTRA
ncbi:MAG: NADH-quinone oxidoreductase subunit G [Lysobacterales bacterium CG17_big_fil_post_rev_8_21_14_2_50_64_11]|nr:MAG: NADH-quinone oxidoreductase subunit G [Xanthomonadales bacterium CG17_big_fil_post_rev_8_21_14_2_50_64_11]